MDTTTASSTEITFLQSRRNQAPPIRVHLFGLFLDYTGLLRCRGRVNNATLSSATKNPILPPTKHPWIKLLILHVHHQVKHSGIIDTLATVREKFWILQGRQAVKGVIRHCVTCNKLEGMYYSSVMPPDLPSFRVSESRPSPTRVWILRALCMYTKPQHMVLIPQRLTYASSHVVQPELYI